MLSFVKYARLRPIAGFFQHYFFVALCCSAAMVESFILLHLPIGVEMLLAGALGTWAVYQTYAWLLHRTSLQAESADKWRLIKALAPAGLAALAAGWLAWPLHLPAWLIPVILIPVLLYYLLALQPRWLPGWVRHSGIKTGLLTLIWTVTTAGLPVVQAPVLAASIPAYLLVERALWMFVLCFMFDQRDVLVDSQSGRTSAATLLSNAAGDWLIAACLLISLLTNLYGWEAGLAWPVVAGKQLFIGLLALVYGWHRQRKPGTLFYLAVVDGMMMVSAGLVIFSSWIAAR